MCGLIPLAMGSKQVRSAAPYALGGLAGLAISQLGKKKDKPKPTPTPANAFYGAPAGGA